VPVRRLPAHRLPARSRAGWGGPGWGGIGCAGDAHGRLRGGHRGALDRSQRRPPADRRHGGERSIGRRLAGGCGRGGTGCRRDGTRRGDARRRNRLGRRHRREVGGRSVKGRVRPPDRALDRQPGRGRRVIRRPRPLTIRRGSTAFGVAGAGRDTGLAVRQGWMQAATVRRPATTGSPRKRDAGLGGCATDGIGRSVRRRPPGRREVGCAAPRRGDGGGGRCGCGGAPLDGSVARHRATANGPAQPQWPAGADGPDGRLGRDRAGQPGDLTGRRGDRTGRRGGRTGRRSAWMGRPGARVSRRRVRTGRRGDGSGPHRGGSGRRGHGCGSYGDRRRWFRARANPARVRRRLEGRQWTGRTGGHRLRA